MATKRKKKLLFVALAATLLYVAKPAPANSIYGIRGWY